MRIRILTSSCSIILFMFLLGLGQFTASAQDANDSAPPLYDDLGDLHYQVSTNDAAQAYFDQGLRLYYAFNHIEAIASFREAQRLDPKCAMCWWGEAISWGPNINLPMDDNAGLAAYAALEKAISLAPDASDKEQKLIAALAKRYQPSPGEDRSEFDAAYANAMKELASSYAQDDNILVLYAESVMDLSPWDYWTEDDQLRPAMEDALAQLTTVMDRSPQHPGACHFFIHAVEEIQPERALPCAEKLADLMPGAGHMVHMPGHIYIRVGRYMDAIKANEHAVHADETFIQDRHPAPGMYTGGYYPHNYDFLAFAAMMVGGEDQAIDASDRLVALIPEQMLHDPAVTFAQHFAMRPALVRIRFDRWQEILAMPDPGPSMPHAQALWFYAQGRALAATGDIEGAKQALARLKNLATGNELAGVRLQFNESQSILSIAATVLAGMIANAEGDLDTALDNLYSAVDQEDALLYGEPPEWTVPVREDLGEVLLAANMPAEAEKVFNSDLQHFPENAWSLAGLTRSLQAQGQTAQANAVKERFHKAWAGKGNGPLS